MPPPFAQLGTREFAALLRHFEFSRQINMVHVHHTWRPNHAQYRGHASIEGMWRHHTQQNGWRDIAQHVSVAPDGSIWLGRNFNLPPASAAGHNGNVQCGPFMIEAIGDFDRGQDELVDPQRASLISVIAAVQQHFGLPHTAIMFHNMMSSKTCPGTSVTFSDLLAEVGAAHTDEVHSRSFAALAEPPPERVLSALAQLSDSIPAAGADESLAEHEPHDAFTLQALERGGFELLPGLTTDMIGALRPHVINLRGGKFSTDGKMVTSAADLDALINHHLEKAAAAARARQQPLRILLYAHGGLVSESAGLRVAHKHLAWWRANGIYPINFVWETGLFETIGDLLKKALGQGERSLGIDLLTDPLIEKAARALAMDTIWRGMKSAAEAASARDGGALHAARKLREFCARHGDDVELHAVGHSAGSIFHAHLLAACKRLGLPAFRTLQLLAPASRIDLFKSHLAPLLGEEHGIDKLTVFTMSRHFELADHCAHVYRKSLLYLVSAAGETEQDAPLLGLETSLRADPETAALFGLTGGAGRADVFWSVSSVTASTSHGGFDDDPATLASVARNVLGITQTDPVVPYPGGSGGARSGAWQEDVDWPEALRRVRPATVASDNTQRAGGGQRAHRALCIGIDQYARKPLNGCVADARAWGAWLRNRGFEVSFLLDGQATAAAILAGIDTLLSHANTGDVVVIQFAGHGTQISDLGAEEEDQLDEAWVPYDFLDGEFVVDDSLGALFDRYRDRGLELVLFTDCCHSGTSSRAAFESTAAPNAANSRFLPVERALQEKFLARHPAAARTGARDDSLGWEIHFAACQDQQSAYEENGQGKFTGAALQVLAQTDSESLTYGRLADTVMRAFINDARQTPQFRATGLRRGWRLFAGTAAAAGPSSRPPQPAADTASSHLRTEPLERIERRLDEISSVLRRMLQ